MNDEIIWRYIPIDEKGKPIRGIEPTTEQAAKVVEAFYRHAPEHLKNNPAILRWLSQTEE